MSRRCPCSRNCRHLVSTQHDGLVALPKLLALEPALGTLLDAADAFDADGLDMDPGCEVHGDRRVSNPTCTCSGQRFSAVEFVLALEAQVRGAQRSERHEPAGRPNRRRDLRVLAAAG